MSVRSKLFLKICLLTAIGLNSFAHADSLSYSGRLVNTNGSPVVGPVNLKFDLASTADTSVVLCSQQISNVALTNGVFHVKLDLNCGAQTFSQVLAAIVAPDSAAIRVTNETAGKAYSYQSLHSVPSAQIAHGLSKLNANNNEVLTWTGSKWEPKPVTGATGGTVTDITAGTGLSGGTITNSGTIAIANGGVTDTHLAGNISRSKLAVGTANSVVVTNGAGVMTEVPQLPVSNGGTGSSTAAGARTNLGLGTAAVANLGYAGGNALPADNIPVCLPAFKLHFTGVGPTYWSCEADNDTNLDITKLPLAGGTMTGAIDMGTKSIINLANPVDPADAVNKAYVDAQVGGTSVWTKSGSDIYNNNSGMVGVGLSTFYPDIKFQIETRPTDSNARAFNADLRQRSTVSGNYSLLGGVVKAQTTIDSGVSNGSNLTGLWNVAFRNNLPGTPDNGTLAGIKGEYIQYGHYNSDAASTPLTTDVYGLYLSPHYKTGTITNLYDIYVHAGSGGGSVSNYYGLYLPGSAKKNYFEGSLGINVVSPTEKLEVDGNIALTGKLRLKSNNLNYVELKAPAALAATLTFNLPGTNGTSGQALITDGSGNISWSTISASGSAVGGDLTGTVGAAQIAAGAIVDADISASAAIDQSKINGLAASFTAKQDFITAGTTAQYWRGDKSWQTLNTTAVPEGTNLYFLDSRVRAALMATYTTGPALPVSTSDTLLQALGKLEGQIVANKTAFDSSGVWSKNSTNVYYNGGNVGIGTNAPATALAVNGTVSSVAMATGTLSATQIGVDGNMAGYPVVSIRNQATSGVSGILFNDSAANGKGFVGHINSAATAPYPQNTISLMGAGVPVTLGIDGYEVMRVGTSGYVGVGTSNPQSRLEVDGSVRWSRATDNSTSRSISLQTATDTNNASNGFANGDSQFILDGGANSGTNTLHFLGSQSRSLNLNLFDGSLFVANKIGVATTTPVTALSNMNALDSFSNVGDSYGTGQNQESLSWKSNASGYTAAIVNASNLATANGLQVRTASTTGTLMTLGTGIATAANANDVLVVKANGKVGIGTTNPYGNLGVHTTGDSIISAFGSDANQQGINVGAGANNRWTLYRNTAANGRYFAIWRDMTGVGGPGNANALTILVNGFMGINNDAPGAMLDVNGYSGAAGVGTMRIRNSFNSGGTRYWQIGPDGNGNGNFVVYNEGLAGAYIVHGQTTWSSSSDRRLKKEIEPIEDSLSKIMQLNGVTYRYKKDKASDPRKAGVIAQDLKKVLPEAVTEANGYLSVKYTEIIPLLIEGIKDLFKENKREIASVREETDIRIKKLEAENAALKKQNAEMNSRLERIEKSLNRP